MLCSTRLSAPNDSIIALFLWRFVTTFARGVTECSFLSHGIAPNSAEHCAFSNQKPYLWNWHRRCNARHHTHFHTEDCVMLYWAAVFFVIALLAAIFGFGGLAASAAGVAKILFFVFLVFALVSFLFGRRSPA